MSAPVRLDQTVAEVAETIGLLRPETDLSPGSTEWSRRISASKVAAILGVSPYTSARALWHQMRGEADRERPNDAMAAGTLLEPAVLAWWRRQQDADEIVMELDQPTFLLGDWGLATPEKHVAFRGGRQTLVEAKTVRLENLDEWGEPGTDQIPIHYLVQCYWQMHVSGVHEVEVPILSAFLEFALYRVTYDAAVGAELEQRCRAFYDSLAAGDPPPLDGSDSTYSAVSRLFRERRDDSEVEISRDIASEYLRARAALKAAAAADNQARAALHEALGDAHYAMCAGVRIARRQKNAGGYHLVQTASDLPALPESSTQQGDTDD